MIRLFKRLRCVLWYGEHDFQRVPTLAPAAVIGYRYRCRRCGRLTWSDYPYLNDHRTL
jgi:hypothetical protein